mgnify:CR=1 FL=1
METICNFKRAFLEFCVNYLDKVACKNQLFLSMWTKEEHLKALYDIYKIRTLLEVLISSSSVENRENVCFFDVEFWKEREILL